MSAGPRVGLECPPDHSANVLVRHRLPIVADPLRLIFEPGGEQRTKLLLRPFAGRRVVDQEPRDPDVEGRERAADLVLKAGIAGQQVGAQFPELPDARAEDGEPIPAGRGCSTTARRSEAAASRYVSDITTSSRSSGNRAPRSAIVRGEPGSWSFPLGEKLPPFGVSRGHLGG